jgi:dipeptidyl aminopeptidase/acylaminoacyl peptidase
MSRLHRLIPLVAFSVFAALAATDVQAQLPVRHGVVRTDTIWSQALGITKHLVVYLPPSYGDSDKADQRYPLAVYLHGGYGSETDWTALGREHHGLAGRAGHG